MQFYSGIQSLFSVTVTVVNLEKYIKDKTITSIIVWNTAVFTLPKDNSFKYFHPGISYL